MKVFWVYVSGNFHLLCNPIVLHFSVRFLNSFASLRIFDVDLRSVDRSLSI